MSNIQHHAIPNDISYSDYVNSLPYKFVIPQGEPVNDGTCTHYLFKVTPYCGGDYVEYEVYGDPDFEQDIIEDMMYG